jgi:iron complex transport system substrate-binding protein
LRCFGAPFVLAALLAGGCAEPVPSGSTAPRVVSLAPNLTEIICAIGAADLLVGRTSVCDYPPEATARIPVIGDFGAPSLELLAQASPTLVLDVDLADETTGRKIEALGFRRERVRCRSLDDIPAAVERIGELLGREFAAGKLATELRAQVAELRRDAVAPEERPSVYVEVWHDPIMTAGRDSFLSQLIDLAGARNIGDAAGRDFFQASPEWVVAADPEVILCLYMSERGEPRNIVLERAGWQGVRAVRTAAVYDDFDPDVLLRPGPRVMQGVAALRRCLEGHTE